MSDLLDRIQRAQIEAGERVVMEDLRAKGFTEIALNEIVSPNQQFEESCYCKEGCVLIGAHEKCVAAGDPSMDCQCGHSLAQHTKGPVRATYCRHCPCPEWEPV